MGICKLFPCATMAPRSCFRLSFVDRTIFLLASFFTNSCAHSLASLQLPFHRSFAAQPAAAHPTNAKPSTSVNDSSVVAHPGIQEDVAAANSREDTFFLMQPHYPDKAYLEGIKPFHRAPKAFHDYTGYYGVQSLRKTFDVATRYGPEMTSKKWLTRFLFLGKQNKRFLSHLNCIYEINYELIAELDEKLMRTNFLLS